MVNVRPAISLTLAIFLVLAFAVGTLAQTYFSLTKGNEWLQYPKLTQAVYISGFLDGMGMMEYAHKRGEAQAMVGKWSSIVNCLAQRKVPVGQIHAVVQKWMNDNPDKWDWNMSIIVWASLGTLCP